MREEREIERGEGERELVLIQAAKIGLIAWLYNEAVKNVVVAVVVGQTN